jgi:predicted AlkP superfamily phosphohydrolase/phosphomutase
MGFLDRFKKEKRKKAVAIGLDGVPFTLLKKLMAMGALPRMSSIFDKGYFGQMEVSIPEISSVSWSSFMTGTQSGEHGIYGFMDFEPSSYRMFFPNYSHLKAPTIWDHLESQKRQSVVINMPSTYPAREINGALISGFVAVDFNRAVYPDHFVPKLRQMGYRIDIDTQKAREDHEFLFKDLLETLQGREKAVNYFWEEIDWDLFVVVITGTDRLMHFLWNAWEDQNHPHHQDFVDYFSQVDAFVGRIYDKLSSLNGMESGRDQFYMLSDHGFTGIRTEIFLNRWLEENGYLKFSSSTPQTIMDIGHGTKAFAMDPSRIYIHLKDKYPWGSVDKNDYEKIRIELKDAFESMVFQNRDKVIRKVYFKEELYRGPFMDQAPDIVLLSNEGFDLKGRLNANIFDRTSLQGMHTQNDAFFFSSGNYKCDSIYDIKDIILKHI